MKFSMVMEQFKLNILRLLLREICHIMQNNCCFTGYIKKKKNVGMNLEILWTDLVQIWYCKVETTSHDFFLPRGPLRLINQCSIYEDFSFRFCVHIIQNRMHLFYMQHDFYQLTQLQIVVPQSRDACIQCCLIQKYQENWIHLQALCRMKHITISNHN